MERLKSPMLDAQQTGPQLIEKDVKWAGHVARLPQDRHLHCLICWKDLVWFRAQKNSPHEQQVHTDRKGNVSRWENVLRRYVSVNWKQQAQHREKWQKLGHRFVKYGGTSMDRSALQENDPHACARRRPRHASSFPIEHSFSTREELSLSHMQKHIHWCHLPAYPKG